MAQCCRALGVVLLPVLLFSHSAAAAQEAVRQVSVTKVVKIAVALLTQGKTVDPAALLVSPGAADELPQGSNGFDVLDDGSLLITDPLRQTISVFDAQGKFKQAWNIGFAADSVTVAADGVVVVREANSGQLHAFDREGKPRPPELAVLPQTAQAQVVTATGGTALPLPSAGACHVPIPVQLSKPGLRLLSLQTLATDAQCNTYVALETTTGSDSDAVSLNKSVRKYAPDGKLLSEAADIPLDYYVVPVDELRVRNGVVYQLMTGASEAQVHEWDMK